MSLDLRLRRLEAAVDPDPGFADVRAWVHSLNSDDLRCLLAFAEESELRTAPPAGMTLDGARARVLTLIATVPEQIRDLLHAFEPDDA
jgi:hypothetical protein